jgi:hypothetical protein
MARAAIKHDPEKDAPRATTRWVGTGFPLANKRGTRLPEPGNRYQFVGKSWFFWLISGFA